MLKQEGNKMNNDIKLLEAGTSIAVVAKNWHQNGVVGVVKTEIEALTRLLHDLNGASELASDLRNERNKLVKLVESFLNQWPLPQVTIIKDQLSPAVKIPSKWHLIELQQSRPLEPLICRSQLSNSEHLFYEHPITGKIFKVINIQENTPNRARVLAYDY